MGMGMDIGIGMGMRTDNEGSGAAIGTREVVAERIYGLCMERGWTPNYLATISAVPQGTIKSILNGESRNPGIVTIKKLCDGFDISLAEFFSTDAFNRLEQEIK